MARSILGNKSRQQSGNQGEQLVQFRHRDAQRLANVLAAHEGGRRDRKPSMLPRAAGGGGGGGGGIVTATFLGSWLRNQTVVVNLNSTPSTNTATCYNSLFSVHGRGLSVSRRCVMAINQDASVVAQYTMINAQY